MNWQEWEAIRIVVPSSATLRRVPFCQLLIFSPHANIHSLRSIPIVQTSRHIMQKWRYSIKTTSFWRNYVKMTSFWRYNDVIVTSRVQWEYLVTGHVIYSSFCYRYTMCLCIFRRYSIDCACTWNSQNTPHTLPARVDELYRMSTVCSLVKGPRDIGSALLYV